uniref:F-box/LRR-repeat protein 15-like leucin rich repeat domain-containing protein n=1 Tax=Ananas comosus var. bracteatus TaxID=296719 RepID=A0A6V7QNT3_ANACO|nr:unnamed protein product [Ananas comosus var. bracteatus]
MRCSGEAAAAAAAAAAEEEEEEILGPGDRALPPLHRNGDDPLQARRALPRHRRRRVPLPPRLRLHTLSFLPSVHLLEIAPTLDLLRPLLPPNPYLRSLRLDCSRLDDSSIGYLARPSLHEICLLNCESISGRLLAELGNKCRDIRTLSVNSLAERRGISICFSDLEELLNGCSQLEDSLPSL